MMDGVCIYPRSEYEKHFIPDYTNTYVSRVAECNNLETLIFRMEKDTTGCFQQVLQPNSFEQYYVIEGTLEVYPAGESAYTLHPGDVFSLEMTRQDLMFRVLEKASLLCLCSSGMLDMDAGKSNTLQPLLEKLQAQDGDTMDHCERVRVLCLEIARELKYDGEKLATLLFAARFHDIGKCRVPLAILIKPARLTDEEFAIMKKHSVYSEALARPVLGVEVATILRQHHERLNGKGYPDGLTGDEIHPAAKIIAVADAYDAMVIRRPYNPGIEPTAAVAELRRCAGTQFDPTCVEALATVLKREGKIAE